MPYPRQLNLSDDQKKKLCSYLNDEITRHLAERTDYIQDLMNWQRDYWVPTPTGESKTPFVGASRIIIPLTAIAVDTIHSRVMNALFAIEPFVTAKFKTLTSEHETKFGRWINYELKHGSAQAHISLESPILDIEKYGTGVTKPAYREIKKKAVRPNPLSPQKEEDFTVTVQRGAVFDHVPIANYLVPNSAVNTETAPWEGEVHLETPFYMQTLEDSGFFVKDTMETLKGWFYRVQTGNNTQDVRVAQEQMEKSQPTWPKQIEWFEICLGFDVDGDGKMEEICVHWHRGANFIMSVYYNQNPDLERGYITGIFLKVEGRRKGIGICKRSEQFQKIITTLHRQRIDAGTLANMRMFKVHRLSNYGPDEPIFPGKMWVLDDMSHIESLQTSEVYTSAFANEQAALLYQQQLLGVNELTAGMPQQGTPGTATDTTLRLQEGSKKLNLEMFNIKKFIDANYISALVMTKLYGSRTMDLYTQTHPDDMVLIQEVLDYPVEVIKSGLLFELKSIGTDNNRTLDRTNWMQIGQQSQQFYTGLMELVSTGLPQQVPIIAQEAILQISATYRQFLETYDVRDEDKLSMNDFLTKLIAQLRSTPNGNGPVAPSGPGNSLGPNGPSNSGSLPSQPRVPLSLPSFGASGSNGPPGTG